jgi:hypothetical protein
MVRKVLSIGFLIVEQSFAHPKLVFLEPARPPLATERLSLLPDGRLLYRLKRRWRGGTTHIIYEPLELMERLAALVPPPKFNITRYSGVLAPGATFRPLVAPWEEAQDPLPHHGCPGRVATPTSDSGNAKEKCGGRPRNHHGLN